jgi:SAM-dependent methyltransferase
MTAAIDPQPAWRALVEAASAPYRAADKFAWHFARGKLSGDPVFRHVLERGLIKPDSRVLDIGCGQGLLASLLHACGVAARAKRWPAGWAAAPAGVHVTGIEMMPHDIKRCEIALGGAATFVCGDMRTTEFPPVDAVVIFDALHYIAPAEQDAVLARVRAALKPGGLLLLRVGNASARRRFALGQWIDRITMVLRGGGFIPLAGRPPEQWAATLRQLGFDVEVEPMNGRPPFSNFLLIGRVRPVAAA